MIAFVPFFGSRISYEDALKGSRIELGLLVFLDMNIGHRTEYFWRYFGV